MACIKKGNEIRIFFLFFTHTFPPLFRLSFFFLFSSFFPVFFPFFLLFPFPQFFPAFSFCQKKGESLMARIYIPVKGGHSYKT